MNPRCADSTDVLARTSSRVELLITLRSTTPSDVSPSVARAIVLTIVSALPDVSEDHVAVVWVAAKPGTTSSQIQVVVVARAGTSRADLLDSVITNLLTPSGLNLQQGIVTQVQETLGPDSLYFFQPESLYLALPGANTPTDASGNTSSASAGFDAPPWTIAVIIIAGGIAIAAVVLIIGYMRKPVARLRM
jgi:hypothetical protein